MAGRSGGARGSRSAMSYGQMDDSATGIMIQPVCEQKQGQPSPVSCRELPFYGAPCPQRPHDAPMMLSCRCTS
eukprot:1139259-Pelagomonas_calceolata.AAC.1